MLISVSSFTLCGRLSNVGIKLRRYSCNSITRELCPHYRSLVYRDLRGIPAVSITVQFFGAANEYRNKLTSDRPNDESLRNLEAVK